MINEFMTMPANELAFAFVMLVIGLGLLFLIELDNRRRTK